MSAPTPEPYDECSVAEPWRVSGTGWVCDGFNRAVFTHTNPEVCVRIVRAINAHDELVAALRGLSNMYSLAWDRVDGALVMLPGSIERFEKAHKAAEDALAQVQS